MAILVLRHEPFEHLGYFATHLREANIPFIYKDLGQPISLNGYTGVIVMGGPQSANDPDPGIAGEIRLIGDAVASGIPILGVCLGAQLIAKALGAPVYRNQATEIGWAPVYFTEAAKLDPVFGHFAAGGLASPTTFFHWHGETFDLPQGAEWLAYSDLCRHQAFRYNRNVYGVQFHPEIEPAMIVDWSAQPANCGDVDSLTEPIDPYAVDSQGLARTVLDGWLSVAGIPVRK
jgi:GMP synthase (glutamine-hydrolysing)